MTVDRATESLCVTLADWFGDRATEFDAAQAQDIMDGAADRMRVWIEANMPPFTPGPEEKGDEAYHRAADEGQDL